MVVLDVKGELAACTMRHRRDVLKQTAIILNPWRVKLARELGIDLGDDGFNPLGLLKLGPDVKDDALLLAMLIVVGKPDMSSSEEFFTRGGRELLVGGMLLLLVQNEGKPITLPELRSKFMADSEELDYFLSEMATCDALDGAISEIGKKYAVMRAESEKQWQGVISSATEPLEIYDRFSYLGQHVERGTFDFSQCKSNPNGTTVYVVLPSDRQPTHAACGAVLQSVPAIFRLQPRAVGSIAEHSHCRP